jgi:hypothetical protein
VNARVAIKEKDLMWPKFMGRISLQPSRRLDAGDGKRVRQKV